MVSPSKVPLDAPKASSSTFKSVEDMKNMLHDTANASKCVRIRAQLSNKQESALVSFLKDNHNIFAWKPTDMPGIPREIVEHAVKHTADG